MNYTEIEPVVVVVSRDRICIEDQAFESLGEAWVRLVQPMLQRNSEKKYGMLKPERFRDYVRAHLARIWDELHPGAEDTYYRDDEMKHIWDMT